MYLSSFTIQGLADLPHFVANNLGRTVIVNGPSPASSAVGDGLALLFGALNEAVLRRLLVRWGLAHEPGSADIEADPFPTQASWVDRHRAKTIVSDTTNRTVRVAADVRLDPPLAADLRSAAAGEPRLGLGLGPDPVVHIEVSAFFGTSWDVLSLSIQAVIIGGERFPCSGKERALWMTRLLVELGRRFINHDQMANHAETALKAMTSPIEHEHEAFHQFTRLVGAVRPAQMEDGHASLLANHRPIGRLGASRVRAIHAAATATLHNADVMWMGDSDPWDNALTESDHAPLEQLWSINSGGLTVDGSDQRSRDVLLFGAGEE